MAGRMISLDSAHGIRPFTSPNGKLMVAGDILWGYWLEDMNRRFGIAGTSEYTVENRINCSWELPMERLKFQNIR
jgi:hypothetical protein